MALGEVYGFWSPGEVRGWNWRRKCVFWDFGDLGVIKSLDGILLVSGGIPWLDMIFISLRSWTS